jgi:L-iditol 2-dehydrogenase
MKAAVMYGPNDIRVERIDKPVCPENGVILQVKAVGLCGSDIRNLTTDSRKGAYPHVYGHEHVGIVAETAPSVTKYKVGERLFVLPDAPCLRCENCLRGRNDLCLDNDAYPEHQGGFAEYMPIPSWGVERGNMYKIPDHVPFEHATLGEPLTSVYGCQETINVCLGDVVVVIGAGPIGCFHAELAKMRGAAKVIAVEINDERLLTIREFGADHIINSLKEDPIKMVLELTEGRGADKVISANPSTEAQGEAVYMCRPGGIVVFFGGVPKGKKAEIDTNFAHYNNIWMYGHLGATIPQNKAAFDLICSGKFRAEKYITHILQLDEINKAIALTKSGEAIKVILIP